MKQFCRPAIIGGAVAVVLGSSFSGAYGAENDELFETLRQDIEIQRKILADQERRLRVLESNVGVGDGEIVPAALTLRPLGSGLVDGLVNERGIVRAQTEQAPVGQARRFRPDLFPGGF